VRGPRDAREEFMKTKTSNQKSLALQVRELLALPYSRVLIPAADGSYAAEVLEFPGCSVQAPTPSEAYARLERAAQRWLSDWLGKGRVAPPPLMNNKSSGRFALRLPRSLYVRASRAAARESVSLNQYIANAVAERVGASTAMAALLGLSSDMSRPPSARTRAN
jgi:predicted HicB family RNase H-like nuclease